MIDVDGLISTDNLTWQKLFLWDLFHILTYALNNFCRPLWVVMIVEIFYRKCYVNCDKNHSKNYNITRDNDNSGKRKIVTELRKKKQICGMINIIFIPVMLKLAMHLMITYNIWNYSCEAIISCIILLNRNNIRKFLGQCLIYLKCINCFEYGRTIYKKSFVFNTIH